MDRAIAASASYLLMRAYAEPVTIAGLQEMQGLAAKLIVWWGLSDLAESQHPVVRLMQHFGGHPFKGDNIEVIAYRFDQIHNRITPGAHEVWKQAKRELNVYGAELSA